LTRRVRGSTITACNEAFEWPEAIMKAEACEVWMGRAAAALMLMAVLAGCASDPARLPVGSTRAEALQKLGKPTATYPLPGGGERLQYSREPSGYEVDNVDLDAAGRVVGVRSMLTYPLYNNPIEIGKWNQDDVLRAYGKPYQVTHVSTFDGAVWSWQYQDNYMPRLFYVYFNPAGTVVRYDTGENPEVMTGGK
jgi:hypothetical protein